jgi:tRNA pseudouridine55 synthase
MDGILIVDKPQGMTSHDVVDFIRKKFALKKVGHAGTLDPMATGVLVVLIGKSTKSSQHFISDDKDYEGELILGSTSDTGDAWGKVEGTGTEVAYTAEEIKAAFDKFEGETQQFPPMYSAIKHKGKKLYELARKGITVEVEPRKISVKNIRILKIGLPAVSFRLTCSKGTYVRQIAIDIGKALGCGAHLSRLIRTRSGKFNISDAVTIDRIKEFSPADLEKALCSI